MIDCRDNNVKDEYKQYGKILLHSHSWKTEEYFLKRVELEYAARRLQALTDLCHAQCI